MIVKTFLDIYVYIRNMKNDNLWMRTILCNVRQMLLDSKFYIFPLLDMIIQIGPSFGNRPQLTRIV